MSTTKAATAAAAAHHSSKLTSDKTIEAGHSENDTDSEEEMLTSSSGCSRPPKKRIRKAVSWDGLHTGNEHRPVSTNSSSNSSSTSITAAIDELYCPEEPQAVLAAAASRASQGGSTTSGGPETSDASSEKLWRNARKDMIFRRDAPPSETLPVEETPNPSDLAEGDTCHVQHPRARPLSPSNYHHDLDDFTKWEVGERYQMTRILGRGSFGEVAQARDLYSCGEFVAIKRIPAAFEKEEDSLRIFREMSLLRKLRGHQCIIHLKDVVQPKSFHDFKDLYLGTACSFFC
jgi:hypothetical protein